MSDGGAVPPRRGVLAPSLVVLAALAALIALGTWQLERKAWKDRLIAALQQRLAAEPTELPRPATWTAADPAALEFRRVRFAAEFVPGQEALVYSSGSALRSDARGPGYWVFAPARLPGGVVVVNRGFVPEEFKDPQRRSQAEPAGPIEITGALRWPEQRGLFTPADAPARNLWFVRDPAAMAQAKNWGPVAPFYLEQEAPPAPGGWPKVGRLEPALPNNHLQYALTWYGLAAVLVAVFIAWLRARRRDLRQPAIPA